MSRKKTTVYIDEDVLRAAKVMAARTDRKDSDVVEEALREYLGLKLLQDLWAKATLTEDEAMDLAVKETRTVRRERYAQKAKT